jgi:hypothetical protein
MGSSHSEPNWWVHKTGDEVILGILLVPCEVEETLADSHVRSMLLIRGSERGSGHVYASDGISRRFPRLCRHWAPAYTFHHLFLVDLVPVVALPSPDALLSRTIFEPC